MATSIYLDRLRQANVESFQHRGLALVVRKAWTPQDLQDGTAIGCPDCWDSVYKTTGDKNCPTCVGTGVVGATNGEGYQDPVFTWGSIVLQDIGRDIEEKEGAGEWRTESASSSMLCYTPILEPRDLVFVVSSYSGTTATSVAMLTEVVGAVQYYTMRGLLTGITPRTFDLEDLLLYQRFRAVVVPENDIRQTLTFA